MANLLSTPYSTEMIKLMKDALVSNDKYMNTEEDTRNVLLENIGKSLKDYWSGNTKEIHPANFQVFKWITLNLIDKSIVENNKFTLIDEPKFVHFDHGELAKCVVNKLCDLYFKTPNVYIPHESLKPSILKSKFNLK